MKYIHMFDIIALERLVLVLIGLDQFFCNFHNFKYQKDQDHGPVVIQFTSLWSPVFFQSLSLLKCIVYQSTCRGL